MEKSQKLFIVAGPCLAESFGMMDEVADCLTKACQKLGVEYYFKASYKKANRTSEGSFEGIGDETALKYLKDIKNKYKVPVLTDVHTEEEAVLAADFVDVLQIPAFLCRQTDLLHAAGATGKTVNIKKGQFMAPDGMKGAVDKVLAKGNNNIWLTERGTFFGYHDLVVDFRGLMIMRQFGFPVLYDATHSVQQPSIGQQSGGNPQFIRQLARAAVAVGIDGLFFETHPDPKNAKSDAATQLPLDAVEGFLTEIIELNKR